MQSGLKLAVDIVAAHVDDNRGLYGLFNNAGIAPYSQFGNCIEDYPMEMYRRAMEMNYFGLIAVTEGFLPLSAHAASKWVTEALVDSRRPKLYLMEVKVSVLEPGFIRTPILSAVNIFKNLLGQGVYSQYEKESMFRVGKYIVLKVPSTKITSSAVVHAMCVTIPKTRHVVGDDAAFIRWLAYLPDRWVDAFILGNHGKTHDLATDDELKLVSAFAHEDGEI